MRFLLRIYKLLLHTYPPEFRRRYGREMSQLFCDSLRDVSRTRSVTGCLAFSLRTAADWITASIRERIAYMRPPHPVAVSANNTFDGVPVFYICEDDIPRRSALINGLFLAIGVFAFVSFLISHGGARRFFLIGSHHPSPSHILSAPSSAVPSADLDSEIRTTPYPGANPIAPYFRLIRVLAALDTDENNIISDWEIASAPSALRKLDRNHDGKLSAEECGFQSADSAPRLRLAFMRTHPVLAALDADQDGEISAAEIKNAPSSLKLLNRNHDGRLTLEELLPDPVSSAMINVIAAFDLDNDGRISAEELKAVQSPSFRTALARADHDHDGFITGDEIGRAILAGELDTTPHRAFRP